MVKRKKKNASSLKKQEKGKAKVEKSIIELNSDDDKSMDPSQENQSDGSGLTLPSKKRKTDFIVIAPSNSQPIELEDNEIPLKNNSAPSNKNQESEFEDDEIPLQKKPDQIDRNVLGPGSRFLPPEAYCFKKTLDPHSVNPQNARLYLDPHEACKLFNCLNEDKSPSSHPRMLLVFDALNRRWDMLLSGCIYGGNLLYKLAGGWKDFVLAHNLRDGEEITFYKNLDTSISDDQYYIIKTTKRKLGNPKGSVKPGSNRKKPIDAC